MIQAYQVYVLQNGAGQHYIGLSEDPDHRLAQHNQGVSQWTRQKGPWQIIWKSQPMPLIEATRLERILKKQKGGDGFYRMTGLRRAGS